MKSRSILLIFSFFVIGLAQAGELVITNAVIHTMESAEAVKGNIHISQGMVESIDTTTFDSTGSDIKVWDAKGKIITPGLFDSSSYIGLQEVDLSTKAKDQAYKGIRFSAGFRVAMAFNQYSSLVPSYRNEGVTHAFIRPAPGLSPVAGLGAVVQLGEGRDPLITDGSALFVYLGETGRGLAGESRAAALQTLLSALEEAQLYEDHQTAYRYRMLRELNLSEQDLKAMSSVLAGDTHLALHIDRASEILTTLKALDSYQLKIILIGAREAWKIAKEISSRNIPVVLNVLDNLPRSFDRLGARLDQAALLHKAGIKIAFMTEDLFTKTRVLTQAAGVAVAHGLPWVEAMKAITKNPAEIWGVEKTIGTISKGKEANLVIWNGDPLELNTYPVAIMINGKWVDMKSRQDLLRDRYKNLDQTDPPFGYR